MTSVFSYIIGLGAAVMMPVIFTILGVCIGIKFGDALKAGLKVGVGFVGLSIVTALLTSALGPALQSVVDIYDLRLQVFDMGWPSGTTGTSHSSAPSSTSRPTHWHGASSEPSSATSSRLSLRT